MVDIQQVKEQQDTYVIRPYNEIKNEMRMLKSHSNELKLKTNSYITNIYLYIFFIVVGIIGLVTKNSIFLLFSAIFLGVIVFFNILNLIV